MNTYIILAILLSAGITMGLRALPFAVFRGKREMPENLMRLGKMLPSAIMAILVVYCLKGAITDFGTQGIPQLTAGMVVAVTYLWKRNTFLSIAAGTACNMLLLHLL